MTRSGLDEVDEAEIFEGAANSLTMKQTYTHQFQCKYELQQYPFDSQVLREGVRNLFKESVRKRGEEGILKIRLQIEPKSLLFKAKLANSKRGERGLMRNGKKERPESQLLGRKLGDFFYYLLYLLYIDAHQLL